MNRITKARDRAFFIFTSIFAPVLLALGYLWSVQSPLKADANNQIVYFLSYAFVLIFFIKKIKALNIFSLLLYIFISFLAFYIYLINEHDFFSNFIIFFIYITTSYIAFSVGEFLDEPYLKIFIDIFISSMVVASLVSSLIVIYQWTGLVNFDENLLLWMHPAISNRLSANLAQPNNLGTLLCLGVGGVYYFIFMKKVFGKSILFLIFPLVFAIFLTGSRTSYLSLIVMSGYLFFCKKNFYGFIPLVILYALSSTYIYWGGYSGLSFPLIIDRGLESGRYLIWSMACDAIMDSPWRGYGVGNITPTFMKYLPMHLNYAEGSVMSSAHNIFLDLAIELGLPVTFFLAAISIFFLYRAIKVKSEVGFLCVYMLIPLLIHSLLEYPLSYSFFLIPFFVFLGAFWGSEKLTPKYMLIKSKSIGLMFSIFCILSLGLILLYIKEFYKIENSYKKLRLQKLGVEVPVKFTGEEFCLLDGYCYFLKVNKNSISQLGADNEISEDVYRVSLYFPTPVTYMKKIIIDLDRGNKDSANSSMVVYCLVFEKKYCNEMRFFINDRYIF